MWWRAESRKTWNEIRGAGAKKAFKHLVHGGKAHGVLAFAQDEPVGWCSFGPRTDFPILETVKAYKNTAIPDAWSIICFFIHRKWRGKGLARGLLKAAVDAMQRHSVRIVEGYPVTTTRDGRRLSSAFAWTGPMKIFDELGFKMVQSSDPLKPLVRLEL